MRRLARRLAWSVGVVWAVVSIAFAVNVLLPGDAARMVAGPQARPADVARIREQLGLDRPPLVQYARFWTRLVHFGPRATRRRRTRAARCCRLWAARRCTSTSVRASRCASPSSTSSQRGCRGPSCSPWPGILVQLLLGVSTGVVAAVRRGTWLDRLLVGTSLLGISAPTFLIALSAPGDSCARASLAAARRLRDEPRRARPLPRLARAHARALRRRVLHATGARRDARAPRRRLGADGAGEGLARLARRHDARAPQRARSRSSPRSASTSARSWAARS